MFIRRFFSALLISLVVSSSALADGISDVLRSVRDVNRTARQGTDLYKEVKSIAVPVIAARQDPMEIDPNRVVFYSATWCGYCTRARKFMQSRQVAFVEYDIEQSPRGYADYRALKGTGVPILLVGDQRMNGWSASQFDQMLKKFKAASAQTENGGAKSPSKESTGSGSAVAEPTVGDVLVTKISNVPLFSSATKDADIVAKLAKDEELVALQTPVGDFVEVQAAGGIGYVDKRMVKILPK
ncbi:glutaredoxin family protein [Povalibacter sp.]|uniref:glutaredoxin family protein n=1 Tax=Povalibacter sp. TaxID=1962978 RepID=UPI002F429EF2